MERKICHNGKDPISLKYIDDIDPKYLVTLRCKNIDICHDIRSLLPRLINGNSIDPVCGLKIHPNVIEQIFEQADELGLLDSTEDEDIDKEDIEDEDIKEEENFVQRRSLIDRAFLPPQFTNPFGNNRLTPKDPDESQRIIERIRENLRPPQLRNPLGNNGRIRENMRLLPREFYPYDF